MSRNNTPYSQLKIFHHFEIIRNLKEGKHCNPLYIRIKPTNRCNHNCSYCHYKNAYLDLDEYNPTDEIPREKMLEIVDDMAKMGVKAVTFSGGGEPLLYSYIEETMERILERGIDLSIITNGSMLKGKKAEILRNAKWVRISVESVNEKEYSRVRGIKEGSFKELCENIKNFAAIKKDSCELGINVVVSKENYKEIRKMAELMRSLGVNHVKYSPLITTDTKGYHEKFREEVVKDLNVLREELADDKFQIIDLYTGDFQNSVNFKRQYSSCPVKEFVCIIAANAKVYYCQDKAYLSNGVVCDLNKNGFYEGWNSAETIQKFKDFDALECCKQHCVHDSRNEMLNSFLSIDMNHINFV